MQMVMVASKLDWSGWIRGVIGALVSGGASSISAGFATTIADPGHDVSLLKLMGITFLFSGVVSMAKFLQTQPVPGELAGNLAHAAADIANAQANLPPKP